MRKHKNYWSKEKDKIKNKRFSGASRPGYLFCLIYQTYSEHTA